MLIKSRLAPHENVLLRLVATVSVNDAAIVRFVVRVVVRVVLQQVRVHAAGGHFAGAAAARALLALAVGGGGVGVGEAVEDGDGDRILRAGVVLPVRLAHAGAFDEHDPLELAALAAGLDELDVDAAPLVTGKLSRVLDAFCYVDIISVHVLCR